MDLQYIITPNVLAYTLDIPRNFRNRVQQTVLSPAGRVSQSFTTRMRHFAPATVSFRRYSSALADRFSIETWRDEASLSAKSFAARNIVAWRWIFIFCRKISRRVRQYIPPGHYPGSRSYYALFFLIQDEVHRIITRMGREMSVEDVAKTHPVIAYASLLRCRSLTTVHYYCLLSRHNCQLLLALK